MPAYECHCLNRDNKRGGGVCILTLRGLDCEILSAFTRITPDYEVITVKCGSFVYCACYRPPERDVSNFLSFLDALLQFVDDFKCTVIIGGDLNINFGTDSAVKLDLES